MAVFVRFPKVDANIEEGMVGPWYKREGDAVRVGELLCELITDKATFDLQAEGEGTLCRVLAPEKSTVPVNMILAVLGEPADVAAAEAENAALMAEYRARTTAGWDKAAASAGTRRERVRAKPSARRLAKQMGVTLEDVAGMADGDMVTEDDVRRYAEAHSNDA